MFSNTYYVRFDTQNKNLPIFSIRDDHSCVKIYGSRAEQTWRRFDEDILDRFIEGEKVLPIPFDSSYVFRLDIDIPEAGEPSTLCYSALVCVNTMDAWHDKSYSNVLKTYQEIRHIYQDLVNPINNTFALAV